MTASGTFNLFPLETACNGIQTIQIPMIKTGRMAKPEQGNNQPLKNYYLEYRTKTGLDASLTSAVYVYAGDDIKAATKTSNWSWLLDMNPSTTTFDGLAAGGSFTDPNGEIKVTVMSADTTKAVVQIDVQGGAGAAPTCMDNTTVEAPGPVDCGSGPATGTGGAGGAGGDRWRDGGRRDDDGQRGARRHDGQRGPRRHDRQRRSGWQRNGRGGRGGTTGGAPDRPGPPGTSAARGRRAAVARRARRARRDDRGRGRAASRVRLARRVRRARRERNRERWRDRNGDGRRRGGHPDGRGRKHGVRQGGRERLPAR